MCVAVYSPLLESLLEWSYRPIVIINFFFFLKLNDWSTIWNSAAMIYWKVIESLKTLPVLEGIESNIYIDK